MKLEYLARLFQVSQLGILVLSPCFVIWYLTACKHSVNPVARGVKRKGFCGSVGVSDRARSV